MKKIILHSLLLFISITAAYSSALATPSDHFFYENTPQLVEEEDPELAEPWTLIQAAICDSYTSCGPCIGGVQSCTYVSPSCFVQTYTQSCGGI